MTSESDPYRFAPIETYGWDLSKAECFTLNGCVCYIVERVEHPEGIETISIIQQPMSSIGYPLEYISRQTTWDKNESFTMVYPYATLAQ